MFPKHLKGCSHLIIKESKLQTLLTWPPRKRRWSCLL